MWNCKNTTRTHEFARTHQVLELPARLFNHSVLAAQDDTHATEVADLGGAHDEGVNVESPRCQNTRHARKDTRLVLHETVEDVPIGA